MKYEFNNDQIEILKTSLENQNDIWGKNKKTRKYYDSDLRRLNECKKILKGGESPQERNHANRNI